MRYQSYRFNSGRDQYLKKIWKSKIENGSSKNRHLRYNKPSKEELTNKRAFGDNKSFPEDTSQTPQESLRPTHWKEGHSYDCPEEYAEQLLEECGL